MDADLYKESKYVFFRKNIYIIMKSEFINLYGSPWSLWFTMVFYWYQVMASSALKPNVTLVPCIDASASATMYQVMASGALKPNITLVPCIDAGASATMYQVMASGALEPNITLVPCIDVGDSATMYYVMSSGDLKLNITRHHAPCIDLGTAWSHIVTIGEKVVYVGGNTKEEQTRVDCSWNVR